MIVNHDKKIVVLLTPKTGSTTLRTLLKEWFVSDYGSHAQIANASQYIYDAGFNPLDYTIFAFHRDPVDRVLSAMSAACMSFIQLSPDRESVQQFLDTVLPGVQAPPVAEDERDTRHIEHLYSHSIGSKALPSEIINRNGEATGGLASQLMWVGHDQIHLLSYEDYENNLTMLCNLLDVPLPSPIPRENESGSRWSREDLPQSEVDFIKEYYKRDYDFFTSKGVVYN